MTKDTRIPRLAALAGAGFFVLGIVGHFSYPKAPDFMARPAAVQDFYVHHVNGVLASNTLFLLSAMLLLVFAGALRARLRRAGGRGEMVATVVPGALVAAVALLMASAGADMTAALHVQQQDTITAPAASVLWDLNHVLQGLAAPMALAVAVLGCALAALRDRVLPAWLGAVSVVLGVALAIPPINHVSFVVFNFWALATGIVLALRETPALAEAPAVEMGLAG